MLKSTIHYLFFNRLVNRSSQYAKQFACSGKAALQAALLSAAITMFISICAALPANAQAAQTPSAGANQARPVGTIKTISGTAIQLATDTGTEVSITVQDGAKVVRIAPGQKDLKDATPIKLQDLAPGDRVLVRGQLADDGKTVLATSIIAISKTDLAAKQAHDREEWQKNGVGGLVSNVDAANGTITIAVASLAEKKTVTLHTTANTILRRYAPDSIKFDDAKPAPIDQIKPGDQLRARGTRSPDGTELTADEIVSGTFRNIAGTISGTDASAGTITVQDLATKKAVTVKITPDSQLRKLPLPMAQRIAVRLKGGAEGQQAAANGSGGGAAGNSAANQPPATRPTGGSSGSGEPGGAGGGRQGGGPPDLQQAINRMPAATIADLQKNDAVMIVATEGSPGASGAVITLLAGVEPILEASPKASASTILSPWSLGSQPGGGEGATP